MKLEQINVASIWSALVATGMAMLWLFQNIAWASDIERIEVRLIKADIREIRREIEVHAGDDVTREYLEEELEELLDELCTLKPEDRECD